MIMDDEYDMCSYSACDHTDIQASSDQHELRSMTALHASPSFYSFVQ